MDYRRFFRQAMMLTITTGLLASCSKDNNVGEPETDALIKIIPGAAYTRVDNSSTSPNNGTITGPVDNSMLKDLTFYFARADYVGGRNPWEYSDQAISGTCYEITENQAKVDLTPTQYYLIDGTETTMQGWYPQGTYGIDGEPFVEFTFTGNEDIIISQPIAGTISDLAINGPEIFKFDHILTQLQFEVIAESAIAAEQWGELKSISLMGETTDCSYWLIEQPDVTWGRNTNNFNVSIKENIDITNERSNSAGMIMIRPRTIGSTSRPNTITLNITTSTTEQPIEVIIDEMSLGNTEFAQGHAYKILLRFLQDEVEIKVTPADWRTPAGEVDVEVGNEYPYIKDGKYIISGDLLGSTGETFHDKWTATEVNTDETCVSAAFEIAESDATVDESSEVNWYIATGTYDKTYNPDTKNACPEGWRLPTIKELELIETFNARLTHPLTENSGYWSATESAEDDGQAHILENNGGLDRQTTKSTVGKVRCVRDI